ncbi:MAG: transporter substrate-binding domain-containing protein [Acetobacteraceae bacterium]|nr:transporter substrate-binding domain-containing protein [Acetobacteraceae bacterium]
MLKWIMATAFTAGMLAGSVLPGHADVLDDIKARGTLVVGVKADYKPFGFRDPSGAIIGLEPDLAADVAKRLGVKLELVPVVSANRMEFLAQGKIDLMIATMSDKPERRKIVQAIEPLYYADFVNVLLPKGSPIKKWEDLAGKKLCGTTGAWYNKTVAEKYGPEVSAFDGSDKPLLSLKGGDCAGYVYDQTYIVGKLLDPDWKDGYAMPLPGILETPWSINVKLGEEKFAKFMTDTSIDWMKKGTIVDLEKKWSVPATEYAARMHEKYK